MRSELAQLQADVSLVATAATDDSLKAASRDDLERAARARLQAEHTHELAKAQQMITALKARTKDLEARPVGDASGDAAATDELDAARDEVNRLREAAERLEASVEREERSADAEASAHGLEARNEAQAAALEAAARHADEAARARRRRARKAFDKVMEHLAVVIRADAASAAPPAAAAAAVAAPGGGGDVARSRRSSAPARSAAASALVAETRSTADAGAGDGDEAYAARVAEDRARARPRPRRGARARGRAALRPAPPARQRAPGAATRRGAQARGGDQDLRAEQAKALKQLEKKHKKELDELKKAADKDQRKAAGELKRVGKELEKAAGELGATGRSAAPRQGRGPRGAHVEPRRAPDQGRPRRRPRDEPRGAPRDDGRRGGQVQDGARAAQKYWNMMEDMKGKIRVFVRCRPFAKYELEKKCGSVVHFDDDTTLTVDGHNGPKVFNFDNVFPPVVGGDAGQGDVFEDTSNLIQSCLDGFNVCIFAYGQTGSGKTFTMTGVRDNPELRGITPRAIHALFDEAQKMAHQCTVTPRRRGSASSSTKKMVFVKNAVVKDAASADELLNLFEAGNAKRHVGATKMNAESSRSHSIFAILVEVYNRTTKKTSVGKLSLVDLAGSERADKTGATDERLKEAQNINKSLSALGDVISALSTGEKFIPYRNNKLTLHQEHGEQDAESEEVAQLKAIIKNLKAGGTGEVAGADVLL
ncbi:hypothetical protein JL722_5417 [Aureococcus anophagefferens]|nr:hypothetical protein JL722_5417 [Aureococcus anophagefferens]